MTTVSPARERLLDAAQRLFYADGITTTGVDRIAAEAEVSKPTLYAQFGSKDALLDAVLRRRHQRRPAELDRYLRDHPGDPRERLLAVFDWLARWHREQGFRGCAFLNAAAEVTEGPVRDTISAHKRWMRDYLAELALAAGAADPIRLGDDLLLLMDGANSRLLADGDQRAADRAGRIAATLLEHTLATRPGTSAR